MKKAACASLLSPFCLLSLLSQPVTAADNPVVDIDNLTTQWTSLEHQKDTLRSNWRKEQPVMEQQLSLLDREREELSGMLEQTAQQQDEVEEQRLALLEEQTRLEQDQALLEQELQASLITLRGLHPQLPPPMKESWDLLLPRVLNTDLSASERLQVLVEMLTGLDDFRRKVSINETVMTMTDGEDYLVTQVYLGLATGWYVSGDGRFAGTGHATPNGWQWQALADSDAVSTLVGILQRRRNAELISLPIMTGGAQ